MEVKICSKEFLSVEYSFTDDKCSLSQSVVVPPNVTCNMDIPTNINSIDLRISKIPKPDFIIPEFQVTNNATMQTPTSRCC